MKTQKTTNTKLMAYLLAFAMVLTSMIATAPQETKAASVQRKISKTAITIDIGKSYRLTIDKKSRYWDPVQKRYYPCWPTDISITPKWSSSNTKVATVTQNGKVTGKSRGNAVIAARVGSTVYKCKVKVLRPVSRKNIAVKSLPCGKTYWVGSMFAVTNKNDYTVEIKYNVEYTINGKKQPYSTSYMVIGSGETCVLSGNGPGDWEKAEFKIHSVEKSGYKSAIDDIEIKLSKDGNTLYVKNNADFTVTDLDIMCYRNNEQGVPDFGIIITVDDFNTKGLKPGKTYSCKVNKPDSNWLNCFGTWVEPEDGSDGYVEPGIPDTFIVEDANNMKVNTIHVTV